MPSGLIQSHLLRGWILYSSPGQFRECFTVGATVLGTGLASHHRGCIDIAVFLCEYSDDSVARSRRWSSELCVPSYRFVMKGSTPKQTPSSFTYCIISSHSAAFSAVKHMFTLTTRPASSARRIPCLVFSNDPGATVKASWVSGVAP